MRTALLERLIAERALPGPPWPFTDDTQRALSVVGSLARFGHIDQDWLARSFAEQYTSERGYGPAMHGLLREIGDGADWRAAAAAQFGGQGSFGNGAAMRVAPLGAYFADDLDLLVDQATRSAEVTHTHHEGIAGAVAVAVAAGLAWHAGRTGSRLEPDDFLELVAERVPASEGRDGIRRARRLGVGCPIRQLARPYDSTGNRAWKIADTRVLQAVVSRVINGAGVPT